MQTIIADFYADLVERSRRELTASGDPPGVYDSPEEICLAWIELQRRFIVPRPRRVERAAEFTPREHTTAVDELQRKFEAGEDVNHYQSRGITNPKCRDDLFNDWGIRHFHLGSESQTDDFVERTGSLLFGRVDEAMVYFISVLEHGAWTNTMLIESLHRNWPHLTKCYALKGVTGTRSMPTSDDVSKARAGGVILLSSLPDGTALAPMGGGITTAGTSVDAVESHDRLAFALKEYERRVKANISRIVADASTQGITLPGTPSFRLDIRPDGWFAVEETSGYKVDVRDLAAE